MAAAGLSDEEVAELRRLIGAVQSALAGDR
jgi:hypothetical protein